ncbi:efflux RND transporter periplasmic adaptor subunit [Paracoccus aerodenitrificans]|uniref:efflux RND transporter periplasmic adaptor subunit n=1 Tax=Paracoccus aerodenitrificans TaxID=3017781 RepID=UPI0022F01659|nr:efflux RND transporter periplasmic adaptor subunit [Paracoccus aerodenitrificans]WBU63433.1 efflux RND transporter periplasmic adaptor subunit [Paracoccus aerodenitrificans]
MKFRKSFLVLLIVALGAAAFGWRVLSQPTPSAPPAIARAEIGSVAQTVLASGMLEAAELVSVGARVSGQIETLAVSLGQKVEAGQLIAQIDSQDQQNDVQMAEAELANLDAQIAAKQAQLDRAGLTYERQKGLNAQSYATAETLETAHSEVRIYEAELDALKARKAAAEVTLSTARIALDRTRITAPTDGTVVAVVVEQGQTVNANNDAPTIVKLADLTTMLVKAEISEADVMRVQPGQNASFTTLGATDRSFKAVLREIEPAPTAIEESDTIDSETAIYYNGMLKVDNPQGTLRIGMTAQVTIELARADNVITVPSAAIRRDGQGRYVLLYERAGETTTRRDVTVGLDNKVNAEIVSGLSEGEMVVTGNRLAAQPNGAEDRRGRPPMRF